MFFNTGELGFNIPYRNGWAADVVQAVFDFPECWQWVAVPDRVKIGENMEVTPADMDGAARRTFESGGNLNRRSDSRIILIYVESWKKKNESPAIS